MRRHIRKRESLVVEASFAYAIEDLPVGSKVVYIFQNPAKDLGRRRELKELYKKRVPRPVGPAVFNPSKLWVIWHSKR